MMKFNCIVKHLICTLVVNNCFFIFGIVTCSILFSIDKIVQVRKTNLNDLAALGEISIAWVSLNGAPAAFIPRLNAPVPAKRSRALSWG